MRPLKSHFRADALTTLESVLQQTKEAHKEGSCSIVQSDF
jgi:hypothetical protein